MTCLYWSQDHKLPYTIGLPLIQHLDDLIYYLLKITATYAMIHTHYINAALYIQSQISCSQIDVEIFIYFSQILPFDKRHFETLVLEKYETR